MKVLLIIFISLFYHFGFSQIQYDYDTLFYSYRISGDIDTVDIANSDLPTTFDDGKSILSTSGLSVRQLTNDLTSNSFNRNYYFQKMKYSALPHLGFAYSFGSQGTTYLHADYSQAFGDKMLLNVDYTLANGNGSLRNTAFQRNDLTMQLQRSANFYSFQLGGSFRQRNAGHAYGIVSDSLIDDFGLEFLPVNKSDAQSIQKEGELYLKNYFNFTGDSLNQFGLVTSHYYSIKNRVYSESDTLSGLYQNVYIDTFQTNDQSNFASIRNAAGLFYSNKKSRFYIDGQLYHRYWDFQNLGAHTDTTELGVLSNARIQFGMFGFENYLEFNVIGGFNEFSNKTTGSFRSKVFRSSAFLLVENLSPIAYQRKYYSNNYDYQISGITKQNGLQFGGEFAYFVKDSVLEIGGFGSFSQLNSIYLFNGDEWKNDTLGDYSLASIGLKAKITYKVINLSTRLTYSIDKNNYLPSFQLNSRLYLKGRLFEAKKLEISGGVEGLFYSDFNARFYSPAVGSYDWYSTTSIAQSMFNLHAFFALGIDEFKFYVRYENISYFWNDKRTIEAQGYPIASPRLRVGITWDFFN